MHSCGSCAAAKVKHDLAIFSGMLPGRFCLILLLMIAALASRGAFAQSTLRGKITDQKTGEPVAYASVFFAHTTLGTSTLEDGTFVIYRIPDGKYDLVVQVVGYKTLKQPFEFDNTELKVELSMLQDVTLLDTVTVVADQSDKKYFPLFFQFFVGTGRMARECKILNPEVLHFYYDKQKKYLAVSARKSVVVANPELGYKVHYSLEQFGLEFETGAKLMQGSPRFEELPGKNKRDSISREKKRNNAYQGSLFHFMRALYLDRLEAEQFTISIADSSTAPGSQGRGEVLHPFKIKEALTEGKVRNLQFKGLLKMEYLEKEDYEYPGRNHSYFKGNNPKGVQQTYMRLQEPITIYENGYYADQRNVFLTGYLVWRETVCNMVPLGHELTVKSRAKGKTKR